MNWEMIAAMGQMLGSVAVLVTLGYVAVQVKHARGEMRRSISQGRADAARELTMYRASNERLSRVMAKASDALNMEPNEFIQSLIEQTALTRDEAFSVFSDQLATWQYRIQVIAYIDDLSQADRYEFDGWTRSLYASGTGKLWYKTQKPRLNPDAVCYIDNLLAQPG